ncbi:MAG: glutathione peroxidase [Rhodospirillaceae bacterium]|nr:MAG: glutathione peroxidase [Rhodospirillaceae bacterium]
MPTAFDFSFIDLQGRPFPLGQFSGRPMVVVNTASKCGFTPQYAGLEALWRSRRDHGLVVLGVPCNDFGGQEPGDASTIAAFCDRTYGVDFPLTAKVHVRGPETHPLFQWLAQEGGYFSRPRWNFYKYLIGRDGCLHDWFGSITPPGAGRFVKAVEKIVGG